MSDVKKGFSTTMGVILALVFLFILLPIGTCAGCMVLGTAASVGSAAGMGTEAGTSTKKSKKDTKKSVPDVVVSNMKWKVLDGNQFLHEATFRFDITNNGSRRVNKSYKIVFEDKDGLIIDETRSYGNKVGAGKTITVSGKTMMPPAKSAQLVAMKIVEK